jgi:hypothetical protein
VPNKDPDGSDNPEGRVQSWRIRIKQPPAAFFTPDLSKCRNTLALHHHLKRTSFFEPHFAVI